MKKLIIITLSLLPFALQSAEISMVENTEANEQLLNAVKSGNLEQVSKALKDGANVNCVNKKDHFKYSPLHYAASGGHIEIVNQIILAKATIDIRNRYNYTPLHEAVKNRKIEVVKKFILLKANLEATNNDHGTPLRIAVENGFVHAVNFLILAKAAINDQAELTSLHLAARNGHSKIANLLIKLNAAIEAKDEDGWTPLFWAANFGRTEVVKVLILGKANIDAIDNCQHAPLYSAAISGHIETVETLLDMGANSRLLDKNNECVLNRLNNIWNFVPKNKPVITKIIKGHREYQDLILANVPKLFEDQYDQFKIPIQIAMLITQYAFGICEIEKNNKGDNHDGP